MKTYGKFAALIVVIVGTLVWLAAGGHQRNQDLLQDRRRSRTDGRPGAGQAPARGRRRRGRLHRPQRPRGRRSSCVQDNRSAQGRLQRHRSAARTPSATARRRWPTASWAGRRLPRQQDSGQVRLQVRSQARRRQASAKCQARPASRGSCMENLGSLAILLAFCLAVYAVAGSVVGRLEAKAVPGRQRRARGLRHLVAGHRGLRHRWSTAC